MGWQEIARKEAAQTWFFVGATLGGISVYFLKELARDFGAYETASMAMALLANPIGWIAICLAGFVLTHQLTINAIVLKRRELIQDEGEIDAHLHAASLTLARRSEPDPNAQLTEWETAPILKALARFVAGNDPRFGFFTDESWEQFDARLEQLDNDHIWRIISDPSALQLVRGLKLDDRMAHAETPRCDLRITRLRSGRLTAGWHGHASHRRPAQELAGLNPEWSLLDLRIVDTLREIGLSLDLIDLPINPCHHHTPLQVVKIGGPPRCKDSDLVFRRRDWLQLSNGDQDEIISFSFDQHPTGLTSISGRWSDVSVSESSDPADILKRLGSGDCLIRPSEREDQYIRLTTVNDGMLPLFCVINEVHALDAALLEAIGIIRPVLGILEPEDGGSRVVPLRVHSDRVYWYLASDALPQEWSTYC